MRPTPRCAPPSSGPRRLARLERRLAATGFAVDAVGVLVAGADRRRGGARRAAPPTCRGVLVGVLAVGSLAAVEVALALVAAARQWTQLRAGLARVADLLDAEPAATVAADDAGAGADLTGPHEVRFADVTVRYRAGPRPPGPASTWTCRPAGGSRWSGRAAPARAPWPPC